MKRNKKENQKKTQSIDDIVNKNKLKAMGVTRDPNMDDIEPVNGEEITGGKDAEQNTTAVCGHWPTTGTQK